MGSWQAQILPLRAGIQEFWCWIAGSLNWQHQAAVLESPLPTINPCSGSKFSCKASYRAPLPASKVECSFPDSGSLRSPRVLPPAFALAIPARTRSEITSRSYSANPARIVRIKRPAAVAALGTAVHRSESRRHFGDGGWRLKQGARRERATTIAQLERQLRVVLPNAPRPPRRMAYRHRMADGAETEAVHHAREITIDEMNAVL
jgi:hypothetical protein